MIEVKSYRDLAETLKKEKRELQNRLQTQTEVVRDFWRNKIFEGGSRGGKILRASLLWNDFYFVMKLLTNNTATAHTLLPMAELEHYLNSQ